MNVQERLLQRRIDPHITDRALTEICRRSLPDHAGDVRGYEVLTGGCWNRVIGVRYGSHDLVLKISPHDGDERIQREFAVLREFAAHTDLPVPAPLFVDAEGLLPGTTLVMTRLRGAVMHECAGLLNYGARRRITDRIAEDLAQLHLIRARGFGGVETAEGERYEQWAEFWLPRFDRVLDEAAASGSVPARLIDGAREIRSRLRTHLDIGQTSTMTHYDIWSGNVMIDVEADPPQVSGYIDIPGFFADPVRELSFAMLFGVADRRFFETYLRTHDLDAGFELRANIYNLKMNIKHIQMYPSQAFYQRGAAENLDFVRSHG